MGSYWKRTQGFTAIEVIAVLIIVGVIAAVVVSRFTGASTYSVPSVAEQLKNHLRYAQTRAMNSNVILASNQPDIWGLYFISNTQYVIYRNGNIGSSNWVTPPGADSDPVDLSGRGVRLGGLGSNIVSFDDWGRPYTDANAKTLQSGARSITVSGGGVTATIQITPNTGYIP